MRAYLSLIAIDLKLIARQRAVIFFQYLFPLIFFFVFALVFRAGRNPAAMVPVLTMSISLGILGNGLFGAGMRSLQEREMNILRRYKVTPITPVPLLVASMFTGWMFFMPYIILVLFLAHSLYGMPWPPQLVSLLVFISIGLIAFRAIGLVIASVANTVQEGAILVQICYFPMLLLSGATIPANVFPRFLQILANFIPATYLVSGMQGIMLRSEDLVVDRIWVLGLIVTAAVGLTVSTKLFRWEKEEKIRGAAKLWVVAALVPFLLLGAYQWYSGQNVIKTDVFGK